MDRIPAILVAVLAGIACSASPASSQYFGRNKVEYDRLHFQHYKTEHFDLYAYPIEEQGARDAARIAERWHERYARAFEHEFLKRKPFILYADQPDFQQTNLQEGTISEGTGGFTEPLKNRVVLPMTGSVADDDHVIGHELVHAFQFDIVEEAKGGGIRGISALPLWFVEGMAEYLSLGRADPHTAMWLRDAIRRDDFPTLRQLSTDSRYFPYRYGQALLAYIGGRWGIDAVVELFRLGARNGLEPAFQRVLGMPGDSLMAQWKDAVETAYTPLMQGRTAPEDVGRRILGTGEEDQALYIAPVVSPDGRLVAFFSARDLFSIDLYVAEVETGRVVRRLVSAATDPHMDALRFVESSGTWSPDGSRFAYVAYAKGANEIVVVDAQDGKTVRRYQVPSVGSIENLAWAPDGGRIAFSGTIGGIGDLFLLDLASGDTRPVTNDRYSDLQPAWSPDGSALAFVTDEGPATDLSLLQAGKARIAILDLASGRKRILCPFEGAKHINPQYSPDGSRLYFLSDPDGFTDIYEMELSTGRVVRRTRVATGVSGITAMAPALSVSRNGVVLFSVFDHAGYYIHGLASVENLVADRPSASSDGEDGASYEQQGPAQEAGGVLPPSVTDAVSQYLADPRTGLATDAVLSVSNYSPKLGFTYLLSPELGVAVDRFGTQLGGAVGAVFSDLLETRELGAAVAVQGDVKDIAVQGYYQNKGSRLWWGVSGGHVPYRSDYAFYGSRPVEVGGDSVMANVYDRYTQRIYQDQLGLAAAYPLNATRRFEGHLTGSHISYGLDHEEIVLSPSGQEIQDRKESLDTPDPIWLAATSAAFVSDNSIFGFTSPMVGGRERFEVGGTGGDLNFATLLLDFRRYLFRKPVTLAFRGMHYGRYGGDAKSDLLSPLFLGYQTLVRGYEPTSFSAQECTAPAPVSGECPEFVRLRGTKIAVFNAELRVPLFGNERLGLIPFSFLPTELALFADAGAAWGLEDPLTLEWARRTTARVPVASAGLSARVNLLGALVLEFYYAYPFQRPVKGGHFGFDIAPGW